MSNLNSHNENRYNNPLNQRHTMELGYMLNEKLSVLKVHKLVSLVNIIILGISSDINEFKNADTEIINLNSNSINIAFNCSLNTYKSIKQLIANINQDNAEQNTEFKSDYKDFTGKIFKYYIGKEIPDHNFFAMHQVKIDTLKELEDFLSTEIKQISSINGKILIEKKIFTSKEDVLKAYNNNKQEGLTNSTFSGTELTGINLNEVCLKNSILINANLMKSSLESSSLEFADFTEANLIGTDFSNSVMIKANLSKTQCIDANFSECDLSETNFTSALLIGTNFRRSNLIKSCLQNATLARCDAYQAKFPESTLNQANLVGANLIDADFTGASLVNADLSTASMQGCKLTKANLSNSKLLNSNLQGINTFNEAIFLEADWWNASIISENLHSYLKNIYPCPLSENERINLHKKMYGKAPSEATIQHQNKLLGIKPPPINIDPPEPKENITPDPAENTEDITQEYLDKLANDYFDDPL